MNWRKRAAQEEHCLIKQYKEKLEETRKISPRCVVVWAYAARSYWSEDIDTRTKVGAVHSLVIFVGVADRNARNSEKARSSR